MKLRAAILSAVMLVPMAAQPRQKIDVSKLGPQVGERVES